MGKVDEVRARLEVAIERARETGIGVATGRWGVYGTLPGRVDTFDEVATRTWVPDGDCACPMGCALLGTELGRDEAGLVGHNKYRDCSALLGISERQVTAFVAGFDQDGCEVDEDAVPFYELGVEFRNRYAPAR